MPKGKSFVRFLTVSEYHSPPHFWLFQTERRTWRWFLLSKIWLSVSTPRPGTSAVSISLPTVVRIERLAGGRTRTQRYGVDEKCSRRRGNDKSRDSSVHQLNEGIVAVLDLIPIPELQYDSASSSGRQISLSYVHTLNTYLRIWSTKFSGSCKSLVKNRLVSASCRSWKGAIFSSWPRLPT